LKQEREMMRQKRELLLDKSQLKPEQQEP